MQPQTEAPSLESLLAGYQRADAKAMAAFVNHINPVLFRFFRSRTNNVAAAEDLLQETWLRIHAARHTYQPGLPVMPWIFAIAEHTRLDMWRKQARRGSREIVTDAPPEPAPQAEPATRAKIDIQALLAKLPEAQREVLVLLKFGGLSLQEVADLKGATVGSIKLKAHRAYDTLRSLLTMKESAK